MPDHWLFLFSLQVIAESLSEEEIKGLKTMFANMDTDQSGTITYEELKTGLARLGSKLSEAEVKQLMEAVSIAIYFPASFFQIVIKMIESEKTNHLINIYMSSG